MLRGILRPDLHPDAKSESIDHARITRAWTFVMTTYVDDKKYKALIEGLAGVLPRIERAALLRAIRHIEPCAVTGEITDDQVALALGEHADIWPLGIRERRESASMLQFRRR